MPDGSLKVSILRGRPSSDLFAAVKRGGNESAHAIVPAGIPAGVSSSWNT
jgi:hypothetical protein